MFKCLKRVDLDILKEQFGLQRLSLFTLHLLSSSVSCSGKHTQTWMYWMDVIQLLLCWCILKTL